MASETVDPIDWSYPPLYTEQYPLSSTYCTLQCGLQITRLAALSQPRTFDFRMPDQRTAGAATQGMEDEEDEGLRNSWGWAGCIRDSMEWWGIRVQWKGSLMCGEILRRVWFVVMSWWGGRVSGGGMLGGIPWIVLTGVRGSCKARLCVAIIAWPSHDLSHCSAATGYVDCFWWWSILDESWMIKEIVLFIFVKAMSWEYHIAMACHIILCYSLLAWNQQWGPIYDSAHNLGSKEIQLPKIYGLCFMMVGVLVFSIVS